MINTYIGVVDLLLVGTGVADLQGGKARVVVLLTCLFLIKANEDSRTKAFCDHFELTVLSFVNLPVFPIKGNIVGKIVQFLGVVLCVLCSYPAYV